MEKQILLFIISLFIISPFISIAQRETNADKPKSSPLDQKIQAEKLKGTDFQAIRIFDWAGRVDENMREFVEKGNLLNLNQQYLKRVFQAGLPAIQLVVPVGPNQFLELELVTYQLLTNDFQVSINSQNGRPAPYTPGLYYRGVVKGSHRSLAAIAIFEDRVIGVIETEEEGNMILGNLKDDALQRYIIYREQDFKARPEIECFADELEPPSHNFDDLNQLNPSSRDAGDCVRAYLECEHNMFLEEGTVQATVDQMTAIFNVVATLYQNESIPTVISEIFVWDTPDSYATSSTFSALNSFRSNRLSFNGDVAHLVSRGAPTGGGVAWVDELCDSHPYAYSYINSTYNQFPTYSWTVNVIAHEMGHTLGSRHTHRCFWNGNNTQIDDCGSVYFTSNGVDDDNDGTTDEEDEAVEGNPCFDINNPILPGSGTIMSYCHLVGGVGINFNNGFGPLPGNLIRARVNAASCLSPCGSCNLSVSISHTNVDCNGAGAGSATANITGGMAPITFLWSNNSTTQTISNLTAGTYSVIVTDNEGCIANDSVTIVTINENTYYTDSDGDGYGNVSNWVQACSAPSGYVADNTDCDDTDAAVNPGVTEVCDDGIDNNCDGKLN